MNNTMMLRNQRGGASYHANPNRSSVLDWSLDFTSFLVG